MSVWEMFKDCPNVCPLKGRFVDTLPTIPESVKIAFAYMDCDLYESYCQTLKWLEHFLVEGSYVLIDDYRDCLGCKKAVDEWRKDKKFDFYEMGQRRYFIWLH